MTIRFIPMCFDAHFHPDDAIHSGFCNSSSPDDWQQTLDYCSTHKAAVPFLGIHPWFGDASPNALDQLRAAVRQHDCGIGEIGLDAGRGPDIKTQLTLLHAQLALADEFARPVTFHCIKAWGDLIGAIKTLDTKRTPCIIHSFSGSPQLAEQLLGLGVYLSFSPQLLNPQRDKLRQAFFATPGDRLLLETDAPHTKPFVSIDELYNAAAELKCVSASQLAVDLKNNGMRIMPQLHY